MKKCSYCGAEYPNEAVTCAVDHQQLVDWMPSSDEPDGILAARLKRQFVLLAASGLAASVLLFVFLGPAANMVLGFIIAVWAANDCSKIQLRGCRVLGFAFKPVVVFAVCAFFFFPLGFLWYLWMRLRVMTSPLDSNPVE